MLLLIYMKCHKENIENIHWIEVYSNFREVHELSQLGNKGHAFVRVQCT